MFSFDVTDSTLVKNIIFDEDLEILTVTLTYGIRRYKCEETFFQEFIQAPSKGSFYQKFIKPNFKQVNFNQMADEKAKTRPKGINKASDKKRFIKMSISVNDIIKDWLHPADNGKVYLNLTLMMLPDGEVDNYENLGMIVQDVPKRIYEVDKSVKGPILGNAAELDFTRTAHKPGEESSTEVTDKMKDDLPF